MISSNHQATAPASLHLKLPTCLALLLCLLFTGCATGRKAYQKGRYQEAVQQSIKRLKSDPDNEKALDVLQQAYPDAQQWHLENIQSAVQSNARFKWETVVNGYRQLNELANAIRSTPAARSLFPNPARYNTELNDAIEKAARARYETGLELLAAGDRLQARQAIDHFRKAQQLSPGYKDIENKLNEAQQLATLKVIINPTTGGTAGLDVAFFENRMHEFITNYRPSPYVRFYTSDEARNLGVNHPDQIINLTFAPFPVGESRQREKQKTYQKKDVLVGRTRSNPPQDVYGTVAADVTTFSLIVEAAAQLDVKILDAQSGKVVRQRRLPGLATWDTSWATYRGDERAIPAEIKPLMKIRPQQPPPPQLLFEHSAANLFDQASNEIRNFYRRVR